MIGGVGSSGNNARYYWYDESSLNSAWRRRIENAMSAWCHTGSQGCGVYTSVWLYNTVNKSSSVIDFYASNNLGNGVYGITSHYVGTGSASTLVYPSSSNKVNWVWAKIRVSPDCCNDEYYKLTTTEKLAMVEHEIGHAFGLAHVQSSKSVLMYPYADQCTADRPTKDDCRGVNSLYGGYNP